MASISPMLCSTAHPDFYPNWMWELKMDGRRTVARVDSGSVTLYGRRGNDITSRYPAIASAVSVACTAGVYDGELVSVDRDGHPNFPALLRATGSEENLRYIIFDVTELNGVDLTGAPLHARKNLLSDYVTVSDRIKISEVFDDGRVLMSEVENLGLEGVIGKDPHSVYEAGARSSSWVKKKVLKMVDCVIVGWTPGSGYRETSFGALHIARKVGDGLRYCGKVGSGFDDASLKILRSRFVPSDNPMFDVENPVVPNTSIEVRYTRMHESGNLREPVFHRISGIAD